MQSEITLAEIGQLDGVGYVFEVGVVLSHVFFTISLLVLGAWFVSISFFSLY